MRKTIYRIITILIIIGLTSFIIIEGLILIEGFKKSADNIDYVIILGARLYGDIPSPALMERLKAAEGYLNNNEKPRVIVSGGQGPDEYIPEAEAMARYLMEKGINEERIIIEDKSTSTYENLRFSLEKLRDIHKSGDINILIVTNRYHIFRAKFLAERLGMNASGLPAKIPLPIIVQSYIREYFAVIKSFIFDR